MRTGHYLRYSLLLFSWLIFTSVQASSLLEESAREFEQLRLQQLQTVQDQQPLAPFTTDGCSGYMSKSWNVLAEKFPGFEKQLGNKPPWESCCHSHDWAYWQGRAENGYNKRKRADETLRQCVIETGKQLAPSLSLKYSTSETHVLDTFAVTADLMYKAVRLGGQPCSLLPWRWGYGRPHCAFASPAKTPANVTDVKSDETIVFFNTAAWFDEQDRLWHIPVHAWIYEPQNSVFRNGLIKSFLDAKYEIEVTADTEANFNRRANLLIADNEEGKRIVIRLAGQDYTLPDSADNGHTSTIIKLPEEIVSAFAHNRQLQFFAVTENDEQRQFQGAVRLVDPTGISVISDIDDTVKISQVTDHKQLFEYTLLKDFIAAPGMADFYQQLHARGAEIHFVSSSPWQLYTPLQEFSQQAGFPWATMELKYVRFKDKTFFNLFKKGIETKPPQIEPLLQHYPHRQFILIGDSGEQDPEVYADIARRYPQQVKQILIRNVDNSRTEDARYKTAFRDIGKNTWQLFKQPVQIDTARFMKNDSNTHASLKSR